jgi:aryl-alcohol dehydrogenase-like predicted oxidoreductase
MRTISIPNTDLKPSILCMGTGSYGGPLDRDISYRLLDTFIDNGGNFLDSAKVYSDWIPGERSRSEKLLGEWMKARGNRERVIIATKGAHPDLSTMHIPRMSPAEIRADLEASLQHLQIDTIDLYWLHRDDPTHTVEEIISELANHVKAGKIRTFGCSNWRVERIQAAQEFAANNGLPGFAGVQNFWNLAHINTQALFDPTMVVMDDGLWDYHQKTNLAAIPYTSQANGLFQKLEAGGEKSLGKGLAATYLNPQTLRRFEQVEKLRAETGLTITQITLGYLLSQPFPTIPVFSCRSLDQLDDTLAAGQVQLTPEQMKFLLA